MDEFGSSRPAEGARKKGYAGYAPQIVIEEQDGRVSQASRRSASRSSSRSARSRPNSRPTSSQSTGSRGMGMMIEEPRMLGRPSRPNSRGGAEEEMEDNKNDYYDRKWLGRLKSGRRYRAQSRANYGMDSYTPKPGDRDIWTKWRKMKHDAVHNGHDLQQRRMRKRSSDFTQVGHKLADALEGQITGGDAAKSHLDVVHNLHLMEKVWLQAEGGMSEDEFTQFLSAILELPPEQLSVLYRKMDANSDGSLTWDEYLSYLLREVSHKWHFRSAEGTWHLREETEAPPCPLNSSATQILRIPGEASGNVPGKYVVACRDGSVQVWNSSTLTHMCDLPVSEAVPAPKPTNGGLTQRRRPKEVLMHSGAQTARGAAPTGSQAHKTSYRKPNTLGAPCVAYYETKNQIVTASRDKNVNFHALAFRQYQIVDGFQCASTPQCLMVTHHNPTRRDLMVVGDTGGYCTMMNPDNNEVFGVRNMHNGESVRKVQLYPSVGILSAGMDARLVMTDPSRFSVVRTLEGHKRGVYAFANCPSFRCIISAGFDRKVLVWDPYISSPTGSLNAHHTKIVDVCVNESKNQIITTCADKKIKIFDIRTFKCIYELVDQAEYYPDELSASLFDPDEQCLVTAGNKMRVWPLAIAPGNKMKKGGPAHGALIVAVLFSIAFEQVISVGVDENVRIWDITKGRNMFEFNTSHNSSITAACLGPKGKRLITGAHNGTISMWNFNNGARIHVFAPRQCEINQLIFISRTMHPLLGIGCEKEIIRWPDSGVPKTVTRMALQGHSNDIGAIATTTDHSMFVTGCVAGELLFWNVDRALPVAKLQLPKVAKGANQVYQPRAGVIYMDILQYPPIPGQNKHCYLLLIGTEDGTLFFVDMLNHRFVHSMPNLLPDGISGIVFDIVNGDHAVHSRLLVSDVVKTAKLYDISQLSFGDVDGTLSLLKTWRPHPKASSITCVERLDVLDCFVTGSDLGDIFCWSNEGEFLCSFGQRLPWPLQPIGLDPTHAHDADLLGDSEEEEERQIPQEIKEADLRLPRYLETHQLCKPLTKTGLRSAGFNVDKQVMRPATSTDELDAYKGVNLYSRLVEVDKSLIDARMIEEELGDERRKSVIGRQRRRRSSVIMGTTHGSLDAGNGAHELPSPRRNRPPRPSHNRSFFPIASSRPR